MVISLTAPTGRRNRKMKTTRQVLAHTLGINSDDLKDSKQLPVSFALHAMKMHTEQAIHEVVKRWHSQKFGSIKYQSLAEIVLEVKEELK